MNNTLHNRPMYGSSWLTTLASQGIYFHALPGRLRLEVPRMQNSPFLADVVREALQDVPGVTRVEVRPVTGRALVEFHPARASHQDLIDRLGKLGCFEAAAHPALAHTPTPQVPGGLHGSSGASDAVHQVSYAGPGGMPARLDRAPTLKRSLARLVAEVAAHAVIEALIGGLL